MLLAAAAAAAACLPATHILPPCMFYCAPYSVLGTPYSTRYRPFRSSPPPLLCWHSHVRHIFSCSRFVGRRMAYHAYRCGSSERTKDITPPLFPPTSTETHPIVQMSNNMKSKGSRHHQTAVTLHFGSGGDPELVSCHPPQAAPRAFALHTGCPQTDLRSLLCSDDVYEVQ